MLLPTYYTLPNTTPPNPTLQSYALLCDKVISLHSVAAEGGLIAKLTHSRRVTAMLLPPPNINSTPTATGAAAGDADNTSPAGAAGAASTASLLLCGLDDGRLCLWDVRAPEAGPVWEIPGAHKTRIRAVTAVVPGEGALVNGVWRECGGVLVWNPSLCGGG